MFPSLADAADAPEVPVVKGAHREEPSAARPRRVIKSNFAGLKKLLEDQNKSGVSDTPKSSTS
jgi:hypothetical protein